jgi:hypothetical protein
MEVQPMSHELHRSSILRLFGVVALFGALVTAVACGDSGETGGGAPGGAGGGAASGSGGSAAGDAAGGSSGSSGSATGGDSGSSATGGNGGGPIGTGGSGTCTPKTCAELGVACGPAPDGCGGFLRCGTCLAGNICDAATHTCIKKNDACTAIAAECG